MTSPIFTGRDGLTFTPDTDTRPFYKLQWQLSAF